jgi:hypothetical protein
VRHEFYSQENSERWYNNPEIMAVYDRVLFMRSAEAVADFLKEGHDAGAAYGICLDIMKTWMAADGVPTRIIRDHCADQAKHIEYLNMACEQRKAP